MAIDTATFASADSPVEPGVSLASSSPRSLESNDAITQVSLETQWLPDPEVPLQLADAIRLSLERNPDLTAARAAGSVAQAAYGVAQVYPWNPQFQTQVLPYSRDANGNDGSVSQQHVIVQTFELGHQQQFRESSAAAAWSQASSTIDQAELLNMAQTMRLYFAALYQHELLTMNQTLAELNEKLVGVIQRQQQAGLANKADVELALLQAQTTRRQQRLAESNLQLAKVSLRNQLNLEEFVPLELPRQWIAWQWLPLNNALGEPATQAPADSSARIQSHAAGMAPVGDGMLRTWILDRPDVSAARSAVSVAQENLQLAQGMRKPNLQIGPMWQRDDSATQFWGVQGQINIPIVNTGAPLVEQRYAELRQQQIMAAQLERKAILQARAAFQRYERARKLMEQSRSEYTRTFADAMKPFDEQFKAGQITLNRVIVARTTIVQSQQSYLNLLNELALAAADVTQAIGMPPEQFMVAREPQLLPLEEIPRP